MRVVTYARVSTTAQGERGASLVNQSRKFALWKARGGHEIVDSYQEMESASTTVRRRLFSRMLEDLPATRPDCIVIDSADRFSRNLEDTFEVIRRLREHGINIWPLEWDRDDPPDIITYDSPDYIRFRDEIIAAQAEAKRIRVRRQRSMQGRRERGATLTMRAPFGLQRDPADRDRLAPSPQAGIVAEIDRRYLAGESPLAILRWLDSEVPGAWKSRPGLRKALLNPSYELAGVRSAQTAAAIRALLATRETRHGLYRLHDHEFTGVFACGRCVAMGVDPKNALMGEQLGYGQAAQPPQMNLVCQSAGNTLGARHPTLYIRVSRIAGAWDQLLAALEVDPADVDAHARRTTAGQGDSKVRRRRLERARARLDQDEAALATRRSRALDFLADAEPRVVAQARKALLAIDADEAELYLRRDVVRGELAQLDQAAATIVDVGAALARYREHYERASVRQRNLLNRALCAAVGSHPIVARDEDHRWGTVSVSWPAVMTEPILAPYRAFAPTLSAACVV